MNTSDLIQSLATKARPVRRLRPPVQRAMSWLVLAVVVLVALILMKGLRPNFFDRLEDATYSIGLVASLLTGVLAAVAACMASLPDRSRLWLLLPLPSAILWLSTMGYQCFAGWVPVDMKGLTVQLAGSCLGTLVLSSTPLSIAMLAMLRHAALLHSKGAVMMGGLAVAAVTTTALMIVHPMDATAMIIGWNLGTAALFVGLAALFEGSAARKARRRGATAG